MPETAAMPKPMLLDRLMPACDAARIEHLVVDGRPDAVYQAARDTDFLDTVHRSAAVRFLFATRTLAERVATRVRSGSGTAPPSPEPPERLRLADMTTHGDWVLLGEDPPREISFGVIGRFWSGETVWETIDAADFESFDRPGLARIACNFSLRPYGAERTLVSYECRTTGTDEAATAGFVRYWRPLSPFIGVVLRAQLRAVARQAASRSQP